MDREKDIILLYIIVKNRASLSVAPAPALQVYFGVAEGFFIATNKAKENKLLDMKRIKPQLLLITYTAVMVLLVINFETALAQINLIKTVLMPFIFGFVIAFVLNRPYKMLDSRVVSPLVSRFKKPDGSRDGLVRTVSIALTYLLLLAFLVALVSFVIPQFVESIMAFSSNMYTYMDEFSKLVNRLLVQYNLSADAAALFNAYWSDLLNTVSNLFTIILPWLMDVAKGLTTGLSNLFIGIVVSVYLLVNKDKLINQSKQLLYAFLPTRGADYAMHVGGIANRVFGGYLTGQLIISIIVGTLCFVGMTIFNMPYAMLSSVVVGVTNVIPYFGPIIGAVPGTLIILLTDPIKALGFVILIVVIQQFDGNFMSPKIVGHSIGLSGVWVLFSILVGGGLFGLPGMVVGLPTFAIIYSLLREATHTRLERKGRSLKKPEELSGAGDAAGDEQ